jgi:hypothetical protein
MRTVSLGFVTAAIVLFAADSPQSMAAPQINNVSLRGLRCGGATLLAIDGSGLSADTKLALGVPIEGQTVRQAATDQHIEVEVTLSEKTAPGIYLLRAVNGDGVSNAIPVGIDALEQLRLSDRVDVLPVALTGAVTGDQSARTTFAGKKDEKIVVEIEARRLLSQLRPVVHLYDARGVQIAWAQASHRFEGDARLSAVLPVDGDYTIEVHDALYQGASPGHFRLTIGGFHYADFAFPSAVHTGSEATVTLLGSNVDPKTQVSVSAPLRPQYFPCPPADTLKTSGLRPAVLASEVIEAIESPSAGENLQSLSAPSAVHGRLTKAGEEDRYRVKAAAGQKLKAEIHAARHGSPVDAVLTVYDAQGKNVLATGDDRPGMKDPAVEFTVPAGASDVVVGVKDLLRRGGDDFAYRLALLSPDRPDFTLAVADERFNVPQGGRSLVRVAVERRGYPGPIDLSFENLPPSIAVENARIEAGSNIGLVLLGGLGGSGEYAAARLVGQAVGGDGSQEIVRTALLPANPLTERQPWLREDLAVAIAKTSPVSLAWEPAASRLPLGGKLSAKVTAKRAGAAAGAVRLSLITTQQMPKKTIKENNQDKQVDDVERTLRLEGAPVIAADQSEALVDLLVPGDLAEMTYGLVLRGELLGGDGKQVLAATYSPAFVARPTRPIAVALHGASAIDARAGLGETGKLSGTITRTAGFHQPVRVTLEGLPAGIPAPFQDVPADQSEFELMVRLPHGLKAGMMNNVSLVGVSLQAPGDLASAVRTNRVPVTLNVVAGEKPPAEPPLRVFEDEEEFVAKLNQGNGQIRLENGQKYTGAASVRVTPDQRFNPALPGLEVKIRKEPGPGEYRYLRFAWKKQGGNQICLQLNHDGAWGPAAGANRPTFRYHAGTGQCFGGSLQIAPAISNQFTVVTRDLYADFGEFTLTGLALSPIDGRFALFDHIYLGRTVDDLDSVKPGN